MRFLIPDGLNIHNSPTYTRVVIVYVEELSPRISLELLAKIGEDLSEETFEEKCAGASGSLASTVSQTVYVFLIRKMLGTFHSRRRGNDIFLFFNTSKLTETQIKYRLFKILGRLFIRRAERIVESTEEKIGRRPYGYLAEIVEFFKRIGEKLLNKAMKFLRSVEAPLPKKLKDVLRRLSKGSKSAPNNNIAIRYSIRTVSKSELHHTTSTSNYNKGCKSNSTIIGKLRDVPISKLSDEDFDSYISYILDSSEIINSG